MCPDVSVNIRLRAARFMIQEAALSLILMSGHGFFVNCVHEMCQYSDDDPTRAENVGM